MTGPGKTVAEQWNGSGWSLVTAPGPGGAGVSRLFGVAANPGSAWAVGEYISGTAYQSLIEHRTGGQWKPVASPDPSVTDNFLAAVTATSASNAWAVGAYQTGSRFQTLIARWDGSTWKQVASPNPSATRNELAAVTATSPDSAWAVGYYHQDAVDQTLIEHWDGSAWKQVASPDPGGPGHDNYLTAVSATSASDAWAVGEYSNGTVDRTLIEHWDGTTWAQVTSPNAGGPTDSNDLFGVAASSPSAAWAVGASGTGRVTRTLIERWDGSSWKPVASPDPGGFGGSNYLYGVSTGSPTTWAVGTYFNGHGYVTLAERWDGTAWMPVASPNGAGSNDTELYAVAVASPASVWAVGGS
jgi:hypothetical protein